jgi:hypothetical protein
MGLFGPKQLNHKEMGERSEAIIIGRFTPIHGKKIP